MKQEPLQDFVFLHHCLCHWSRSFHLVIARFLVLMRGPTFSPTSQHLTVDIRDSPGSYATCRELSPSAGVASLSFKQIHSITWLSLSTAPWSSRVIKTFSHLLCLNATVNQLKRNTRNTLGVFTAKRHVVLQPWPCRISIGAGASLSRHSVSTFFFIP